MKHIACYLNGILLKLYALAKTVFRLRSFLSFQIVKNVPKTGFWDFLRKSCH